MLPPDTHSSRLFFFKQKQRKLNSTLNDYQTNENIANEKKEKCEEKPCTS
jgi:hypothetical protein